MNLTIKTGNSSQITAQVIPTINSSQRPANRNPKRLTRKKGIVTITLAIATMPRDYDRPYYYDPYYYGPYYYPYYYYGPGLSINVPFFSLTIP